MKRLAVHRRPIELRRLELAGDILARRSPVTFEMLPASSWSSYCVTSRRGAGSLLAPWNWKNATGTRMTSIQNAIVFERRPAGAGLVGRLIGHGLCSYAAIRVVCTENYVLRRETDSYFFFPSVTRDWRHMAGAGSLLHDPGHILPGNLVWCIEPDETGVGYRNSGWRSSCAATAQISIDFGPLVIQYAHYQPAERSTGSRRCPPPGGYAFAPAPFPGHTPV